MAKEALNQIAEAEANGKAQKRSAQEEAAKILGQIKADSEKLINEKLESTRIFVNEIYADADIKVKEILENAKIEAEKENSSLKEIIKKNEESVVISVINLLV